MWNMIKNDFKGFNWKLCWIRTFMLYGVLAIILGFMVGFKTEAQEKEPTWIPFENNVESDIMLFILKENRPHIEVKNPTLTTMLIVKGKYPAYSQWEFNCKDKCLRMIKRGNSLRSMEKPKIHNYWFIPKHSSQSEMLLRNVCGGN